MRKQQDKSGTYRSILGKIEKLQTAADKAMEKIALTEGNLPLKASEREPLAVTACYVLAPALTAFLSWLLTRAQKTGIKRLYFLARDGYFMYRGAVMLCREYQIPVECRYLECSRYSLRLPVYHKNHEEALDFICRGGIDVTLHRILLRAGLTEAEVLFIADQMGALEALDRVMNYSDTRKLMEVLGKNDLFLCLMDDHSRKAYDNAVGYLIQEGLADEIPYGIVDSGWTGSMQKVLKELMAQNGYQGRIHGFYWGLYELPQDCCSEDYEAFYFEPRRQLRRKVHFSNCLFECIFSAPGGMTVRYAKGDIYYPVHGRTQVENYDVLNSLEVCFMAFWDSFVRAADGLESYSGKQCCKVIASLIGLFMTKPSKEEAQLFGDLLFSDDVVDGQMQKVAAELEEEGLRSNYLFTRVKIMTGYSPKKLAESAWYEGSAVKYGLHTHKNIRKYAGYKYFVYLRKGWKNRWADLKI